MKRLIIFLFVLAQIQDSYAATCGKKGSESQDSSKERTHAGSSEKDPYSKCFGSPIDENSPVEELERHLIQPEVSQEQKFKEKLDQIERDMSELDPNSDDYAQSIADIQRRFAEMAEEIRNRAMELGQEGHLLLLMTNPLLEA